MHIRCRWVYGTTVIPYYDHTMRDEEGTDSERLSLLSGVSGVKIEAKDIVNKTHQAKGKVGDLPESDDYFKTDAENHLTYEKLYKEKQDVSTSVEGKADDRAAAGKDNQTGDKLPDISSLHINSKIFKLTDDATAKYLIETNKKFADYHEFLSSDYLLERVKADPEKVGKRLGVGIGIDLSGKNKKDGIATTDKKDKVSNANKTGIFGSATKSNVDSNYESVTNQSGIYAGKEGFDIRVEDNTDLKGGIIFSEAEKDKNKISTGTLTYEDIKNKAEYEAGSTGINVDTSAGAEKKDAGGTPNIGVGAKDDAESVTKATVSEGEIEIRDKGHQKQDLKDLNRDTQNSLNKLGEIFDKTKVEERQELAGLFGEIAYKAVGDLAIKNGWQEGSAEKNALHALVGGIMSELTNSGFLAGASGAMINEMIQDKLSDMFKDNPAMHQWASALIGGVVAQVVADNAQVGAATASSGTKNNFLTHEQELERIAKLDEIDRRTDLTVEEKFKKKEEVNNYYIELSRNQTEQGIYGEKEGFGYEYGYDPELGGMLNVLPNDINASNNLRQLLTAFEVGKNIDVSSWRENEMRSLSIGGSVKIFSGSTGYAMDSKHNIYRVSVVGIGRDLDLSKYTMSNFIKAITFFNLEYNSQAINGSYTAKELAEIYQGSSIGGTYSHVINIGISESNGELLASYGVSNTFLGGVLAQAKVEYIGNAKEGL